jgi:hypothetical protein
MSLAAPRLLPQNCQTAFAKRRGSIFFTRLVLLCERRCCVGFDEHTPWTAPLVDAGWSVCNDTRRTPRGARRRVMDGERVNLLNPEAGESSANFSAKILALTR